MDENEQGPAIVKALKCLECEALVEADGEIGPLYECSRCGDRFTRDTSADGSNRCPQCNIFGAKFADHGCPECNAGEMEEARVVEIDGDLVEVDGDGTAEELVARAEARKAEEARRAAEVQAFKDREEAERRDAFEALPIVALSEVRPGDVIAWHDPDSHWDKYPDLTVGRAAPDADGRIRIAPPGGIGLNILGHPDETVRLKERPEAAPENEPSIEERLRTVLR